LELSIYVHVVFVVVAADVLEIKMHKKKTKLKIDKTITITIIKMIKKILIK
jgi:hypothetical protein